MARNCKHSQKILKILGNALDLVLASFLSQEISHMIGDLLRQIGSADARHQERKKDISRQETAESMVA